MLLEYDKESLEKLFDAIIPVHILTVFGDDGPSAMENKAQMLDNLAITGEYENILQLHKVLYCIWERPSRSAALTILADKIHKALNEYDVDYDNELQELLDR